jgi:poly(3-hydroxybutyrate) depolymerase
MTRTTTPPVRPTARGRLIAGLSAAAAVALTLAAAAPAAGPAAAATTKACSTPDFTDVRKGATFYEAITWLRCEKISTGYGNGTYGPGQQITRGETAQLLYRFSGESHDAGTQLDFDDVLSTRSAFTAVSWMKQKGLTRGYSDGTFGVDEPISRGELAAFLYRLSGAKVATSGDSPFTDMDARDTFYAPAVWFQKTGLVKGYSDGSFRPGQAVTRGETAKFLYALETELNGTPPAYSVPAAPAPAPAPIAETAANATGGKGGAYQDATSLTYSNGATTSEYHLYADHLNGAKPHGIIVHLHGDGGWEYRDTKWSTTPAYAELARKNNLMLVVPRTPDRSSNTWWRQDSSGKYAADLLKHLGTKYNLDLNQVYWTGYSGGADTVARHMVNSHSAGWTGGAAVIVAGGGIYGQSKPRQPISATLRKNFEMHWIVGADDTPAAGGASGSFDAVEAARLGHSFYTQQGMRTSLTVVPGKGHFDIYPKGPAKLAEILARR